MTENLTSYVSVSLAYDCASVITMETFLQLTESNVRDLVLSSCCELPKCVTPSPGMVTLLMDESAQGLIHFWKSRLDKNYRLISSVPYFSKLVERDLFEQTHGHMVQHHIYPVLQSSYRAGHSTETALLKGCESHHACHEFTMCHAFCILRPYRGTQREFSEEFLFGRRFEI